MNSDVQLDYALFQLSPRWTRCELFVSGEGKTEKLASGYFNPFVTHLKVAGEQASQAPNLIKLELGRGKNAASWFNKGTVERFVRFVSTPEVLELVNTFDEEMSQLEGAKKVYSQGAGVQYADEREIKSAAAADATKKELLRAIDLRCIAVKQDLATAFARAEAAGFNLESVSELLQFAEQFGTFRLSEACHKFLSVKQRRPELISHQHSLASPAINSQAKGFNDANASSSFEPDMSIDRREDEPIVSRSEQPKPDPRCFLEEMRKVEESPALGAGNGSRRLSVKDRINLFESKQNMRSASDNTGSGGSGVTILGKSIGSKGNHRRKPSDVSVEKAVLQRWSGNLHSSNDLKDSAAGTSTSSANSQLQTCSRNAENEGGCLIDSSKFYSLPSSKNSSIAITPVFSSSQHKDRKFPTEKTPNRDEVYREGSPSISVETAGLTLEEVKTYSMNQPADHKDAFCIAEKTRAASVPILKAYSCERADAGAKSKNVLNSQIQLKASVTNVEGASVEACSILLPHSHCSSSCEEQQETRPKSLASPQIQSKNDSSEINQGPVDLIFLEKKSVTGHSKIQGSRDSTVSNAAEFVASKPFPSLGEFGIVRTNKGNHELDDVLQTKAHELEKLFTQHKLRIHRDHATSTQSSKTLEDYKTKSVHQMPEKSLSRKVSSNALEFNSNLLLGIHDGVDYSHAQIQKMVNYTPADSKGKLYGKYMQKRDAKLKEECGSNRVQKDAKMKAMYESLELSQAELKGRVAGFSDRQNLAHVRRRAEKMRSFNSRLINKSKN